MGPGLDFSDGARDALRAIVATIDREMSHLSRPAESEGNRTTDELRSSWAELVELLALGPAPEVRECPVCKHMGMREASRCGYCWTKLSPLTSAANGSRTSPRLDLLGEANRELPQ